jgi:polysaccharide deacetylase family protein (PEP-CTERM system associated)
MNVVTKMSNILQIDVEDWYCDLDPKDWHNYQPRVVDATHKILGILGNTGNTATFFVLGHVAELFPGLIQRIVSEGHEIASHGYHHGRIPDQKPEDFERDLVRSINILEDITGKKVMGYRAPQFTIMKETLWALEIMRKHGLEYDSSIFPVKTPLYGIPDAPLFPHKIGSGKAMSGEDFLEIPLSVYKIPLFGKNVPVAGGFYLRFFPYAFIRYALKNINKANNVAVCYIHPWELDPGKPRIDSLRWYHYYRLKTTEKKFQRLLKDFKFTSTYGWIKHERRQ